MPKQPQGDPAQGAPCAPAGAPAEFRLLELFSPGDKLRVDPLNSSRTDALEVLRRTRGQIVQIEGAEPLGRTGERPSCAIARCVRIVPHIIDFDRSFIEPGVPFGLHLQALGTNRVLNLDRHDSIPKLPYSKLPEQCANLF